MANPIISLHRVHKTYGNGAIGLKDISFQVYEGDFLLITGHSGSGKSTLLKLLYGAETKTSGDVKVCGISVHQLHGDRLAKLRRQLGVVFQDYKLIPYRTVFQNVALVLQSQGYPFLEVKKRTTNALSMVHLQDRSACLPLQLSGGEQQRVGIARAIVHSPSVLLADEPTGNLDPENTQQIIHIFEKLHQCGVTILVTTHDQQWLTHAPNNRMLHLNHGRLEVKNNSQN